MSYYRLIVEVEDGISPAGNVSKACFVETTGGKVIDVCSGAMIKGDNADHARTMALGVALSLLGNKLTRVAKIPEEIFERFVPGVD